MPGTGDLAETMTLIAGDARGDFSAIPIGDLLVAGRALVATNSAACSVLVSQCNGDWERARLELSRALALPQRVLARRAEEAKSVIEAGGMPSVPQVAAWCTVVRAEIERIATRVDLLRSGASFH